MQYGPYAYAAPEGPRAGQEAGWFWSVSGEPSRVEVHGRLGGIYLVGRRDYETRCQLWQAVEPPPRSVTWRKESVN